MIASLKPGSKLAIVAFRARPGFTLPTGVRANREGNGIPSSVVVDELCAVGLTHLTTIPRWPPGGENTRTHLTLFGKP